MTTYIAKKFTIPALEGISAKNIEEHIKLYEGYVTHSNLVLEKIQELSSDFEKNMGTISGLERRFGFEYNGMRNHEIYFSLLENGSKEIAQDSNLYKKITEDFGSFENWLSQFKSLATTRGVGWTMLYYDRKNNSLINAWIDEQHLGQLQDCALIVGLDMWEHSYVGDYWSSGKKQYIEDFFKNVNWNVAETNFDEAVK